MAQKTEWQIEKRINLGDIFTLVGISIAMLTFVGSGWLYLYNRVDKNTDDIRIIHYQVDTIRDEMRKDRQDIKEDLNEIKASIRVVSDKLDNKADKD